MSIPLSPRRLAENEVFLRQKNRAIEEQYKRIKDMAVAHQQVDIINDEDVKLQFFCECSDENCQARIPLKRSEYDKIHKADDRFVVIRGHEVPVIEQVVEKTNIYAVVRKNVEPPKSSSKLNPTPINNV